ncbi:hypothetical protein LAZ40_11805 [Cereibacter sphaeroides]|uniref:hypothetical protein n=1 Tax=Cereibacter sphaeroides TaxID=1063 RepID=UPI001F215BA3|nr:hypothetical protein [Cereibacter sphaeroides]MCE6959704.1 hypothetical protein [Cereibacter sphaeroides]MCE6974435.1 hypothetical protein [Cereibacter sphaeroides]
MIGFYVMMVAVLALAAASGYTIFTSVHSANGLAFAERNAARMDQAMAALRQVVILDATGNMFVPNGQTGSLGPTGARQTLVPDWVSSHAGTPWGAPFGYCAYAPVSMAGATETASRIHDAGGGYSIGITEGPSVFGAQRSYVSSGARDGSGDAGGAPEVLAFLTSPSLNGDVPPACGDIRWDGETWIVGGEIRGAVQALTLDTMSESLAMAPRILTRHVAPAGTGSGRSATEPSDLAEALGEFRWIGPGRMTIKFADGTYDIGPDDLDPGIDGFGRSLVLEGDGAGTVIHLTGIDPLRIATDTSVSNVTFDANTRLKIEPGVRFRVTGTSAHLQGGLTVTGGTAVLTDGVSVAAPSGKTPAILQSGLLAVAGGVSISASGATTRPLSLQAGTLHLSGLLTLAADGTVPSDSASHANLSIDTDASVIFNGASIPTSDLAPTAFDAEEVTQDCNDVTCEVICGKGLYVVSGDCAITSSTDYFIDSKSVSPNRSSFTCHISKVTTTPVPGYGRLTAKALCAPVRISTPSP